MVCPQEIHAHSSHSHALPQQRCPLILDTSLCDDGSFTLFFYTRTRGRTHQRAYVLLRSRCADVTTHFFSPSRARPVEGAGRDSRALGCYSAGCNMCFTSTQIFITSRDALGLSNIWSRFLSDLSDLPCSRPPL